MANFGFVINNRTCIGCHACSTACKAENEVPLGVSRTWVKYTEVGAYPDVRRNFQVTRCNHCANPPCVRICPVEAMYQRSDGIVEFDQDQCIGCKACLQACPYDAIHIDPDSGTAAKCHYCAHRTDIGLEPACVVVCPEHAIISGDMDDPASEISRVLASEQVTVRKPEQGTAPKLFYVDGNDFALVPTATPRAPETFMWADVVPLEGEVKVKPHVPPGAAQAAGTARRSAEAQGHPSGGPIQYAPGRVAEHMVQVGYNAQHLVPWHWPVPAYLVTKGIGGGVFALLALGVLLGLFPADGGTLIAGGFVSLLMIGATTALLVYDLERPERFLRVLTRPQWGSWLTRGAYLLVGFTVVAGAWWLTELFAWGGLVSSETAASLRPIGLGLGLPFALGAIVYTAFLFGQAEGRDLWQSPLLPVHLLIQSAMMGGGTLLLLAGVFGLPAEVASVSGAVFATALVVDLAAILWGELGMPHATETAAAAAHRMSRGKYRKQMWLGGILLGHLVPLALLGVAWPGLAALAAMAGLYFYEHAYVLAPQENPEQLSHLMSNAKHPTFLERLLRMTEPRVRPSGTQMTNVAGEALPTFGEAERKPVKLEVVHHPDGRMSQYPPPETWDDWVEWDAKAWPRRKARRYMLVPTVCFNCESACGLLAYVDKTTFEVKKFEGNPAHPGSRGRNCAKGPATHNQVYDPERILYPLKRVGARGEGKWKRVTWEEALGDIGARMRASRERRKDGIMYHVGRPGEDGFTNRCISAWGVDGHNSHTNICSSGARAGYSFWAGFDRPSPDYAHARCILLISSHLETGHYFNPHAQRIMEAKENGAKLITLDPRLSNTASKSDVWLPTWPGTETHLLLAIARHLIQTRRYDRDFVRRWVNWRELLVAAPNGIDTPEARAVLDRTKGADPESLSFEDFEAVLDALYAEFTFERAAELSEVPIDRIRAAAEAVADCDGRLAAHVWRSASIGNLGGWQVARCLFFLNVLTGSVGTPGGTSGNSWNKFVPKPFAQPPALDAWNELHLPHEWPFAFYEMSFLLPHFLEEGRGDIDVYFSRVYNPMWINPDGFMWLKALRDEEKMKFHVALTPTWNESAWFADYVLPMGHAGERHDLMSQETHSGRSIAFRQPVRRVALEKAGHPVRFTYEANPGEVWEENEFWTELSLNIDPDGSLGVRKWFMSPYREGETITVEEYYRWIFENSVPGLPEAAAEYGLSPLAYMRKFGCFEVSSGDYTPYEKEVEGRSVDPLGRVLDAQGKPMGVLIDGVSRKGFETPSRKLELWSATLDQWGWSDKSYTLPWPLESHVSRNNIDVDKGEMLLLPNFRLPTLIHTRSANAKWLYEISHKNPVWMNPQDAHRLGVQTGDLLRVQTEIGWFIDRVWVTEGIKPGVIAMSHHLGRWRLEANKGVGAGMSNLVSLSEDGEGQHRLVVEHGAKPWKTFDPDTERVWWEDVGVHQNLTHAVHPDPISGAHCWLQKAVDVRKAGPNERFGEVFVDTRASMRVYREWVALTRSSHDVSPDGTRRPMWLKRPLKPVAAAYANPPRDKV